MEDVTYLKINLYLRMLHPLTTTGVIPILILVVLNMRITKGIKELQVSFSLKSLIISYQRQAYLDVKIQSLSAIFSQLG
jgi:hypothetical protein